MSLTVQTREKTGKGPNRQLQMTGHAPGIIYGVNGNTNVSMRCDYATRFVDANHGNQQPVEITVENGGKSETKSVIIKDVQFSNWGHKLVHVDFMEVTPETKVTVNVRIKPSDNCPAIKVGGLVQMIRRSIPVMGMVKDIPEFLHADVDTLEFGDSFHVLDIDYPEGVVPKVAGRNFTIITISGKKKGKEEDEEEEEGTETAATEEAAAE